MKQNFKLVEKVTHKIDDVNTFFLKKKIGYFF